MKTTRSIRSVLLACLGAGVLVAGQTFGANLRYKGNGDYFDTTNSTANINGWQTNVVPGAADTARFNWASNTVTLAGAAPNVTVFEMGVDESGGLVVNNGGSLSATGSSVVGKNVPSGTQKPTTGFLTINSGGVVNAGGSSFKLGGTAPTTNLPGVLKGFITLSGGTLNVSGHLWVAAVTNSIGTIDISSGGVLNMLGVGGSGMLGLGTGNASAASGGQGFLNVQDGGVLNLFNIHSTAQQSIWPGSVLDISGSGVVTIPGNFVSVMNGYIAAGRITAHGGTGTVVVDYNTTNPGKTTLTANHIPTASAIETTVGLGGSVTIPIIGGKYAPSDLDAADVPNLIVSAVGGSPARGTATKTSTHVTYTSNGSSSGADSFTYTVSDQRGGLVTRTITVTVGAGGNGANLVSLSGTVPNITINFAGMPGSTYAIERATSPSGPWTNQGTASTGANGLGSFTDDDAPSPTGYFRTLYLSTP